MLSELDTSDWEEAFKYAQGSDVEVVLPARQALTAFSFTREAVEEIYGIAEGERDGEPWIIYGKLHSGYYFYLEAGCDYTGWG